MKAYCLLFIVLVSSSGICLPAAGRGAARSRHTLSPRLALDRGMIRQTFQRITRDESVARMATVLLLFRHEAQNCLATISGNVQVLLLGGAADSEREVFRTLEKMTFSLSRRIREWTEQAELTEERLLREELDEIIGQWQAALSRAQLGRHTPDRRAKYLDTAITYGNRLVRYLNLLRSILDDDIHLEQFDVARLFDPGESALVWENPFSEMPEGTFRAQGWKAGLEMVISNVRRNAARHGAAGTQIIAPRETIRYTRDSLVVEVSDARGGFDINMLKQEAIRRGIWTAAEADAKTEGEAIELIFIRGFSTRKLKTSVSGYGLWLSREIIRSYFNGSIRAENRVNYTGERIGATFIIEIPLLGSAAAGFPLRPTDVFRPSMDGRLINVAI